MPAYRFCRPDDIPLLVSYVNSCFNVHFPELERETISSFKRQCKEYDLWPSSCVIAYEGDEAIGVVVGCKRPERSLLLKVGIAPQHMRQGHASHLLTSLSGKLAVLGPPQIHVELAEHQEEQRAFFEALGYGADRTYIDFALSENIAMDADSALVSQIGVGELLENAQLEDECERAWMRELATIENRKDSLNAYAVYSDKIEAYLVCEHCADECRVLRCYAESVPLGKLLFAALSKDASQQIVLHKLSDGELPETFLDALGFAPATKHYRYSTVAKPA